MGGWENLLAIFLHSDISNRTLLKHRICFIFLLILYRLRTSYLSACAHRFARVCYDSIPIYSVDKASIKLVDIVMLKLSDSFNYVAVTSSKYICVMYKRASFIGTWKRACCKHIFFESEAFNCTRKSKSDLY